MESVGGYAYFVSEGTLSAEPIFVRLLSDCFKSKEDKRL